jgi:hypothetical protein
MIAEGGVWWILTTLLYLVTIVTGLWIGSLGKPYAASLFSLHKLAGFGVVILASFIVQTLKTDSFSDLITILIATALLAVVALFATGGLMSAQNTLNILLKNIHIIATTVFTAACGGTVYLLFKMIP